MTMSIPSQYVDMKTNEPAALTRIEGLLTAEEGFRATPYPDIKGNVTIGIGTKIDPRTTTGQQYLAIVLQQMTFDVQVNGQTQSLNVFQAAALQAQNTHATTPSLQTIVAKFAADLPDTNKLTADLKSYFQGVTTDTTTIEFSLTRSQALSVVDLIIDGDTITGAGGSNDKIQVTGISQTLAQMLTNRGVDQSLWPAADSDQWAALISMMYHGPDEIKGGENFLSKALSASNSAQAWYYIRYGQPGSGFAARDYTEAQTFGLNGAAGSGSQSFALAIQDYEMLTEHRSTIVEYEQKNGAGIATANDNIRNNLQPGQTLPSTLQGTNPVQTLAQVFNPEAEQIATAINGWYSGVLPSVGVLNDTMSGAFEVRSTDILIAPDSIEIANGFATSLQDDVEAVDSPTANHILIGPDTVDLTSTQQQAALIGGLGDDLVIAGAGNELLSGGLAGNDTLIGGQGLPESIAGAAGNDTLEGGAGTDTFVFVAPTAGAITETILPWENQAGAVEAIINGVAQSLGGSLTAKLKPVSNATNVWSVDGTTNGIQYTYDKTTGELKISGGDLGSNVIDIKNFDVQAAENDSVGYLGICLQGSIKVTPVLSSALPGLALGVGLPTYSVSVDTPSDVARTITVTLSGAPGSGFMLEANGTLGALSSDTFTLTLPPGATHADFSLLATSLTADASLSISAAMTQGSSTITSDAVKANYAASPTVSGDATEIYSNSTPDSLTGGVYTVHADNNGYYDVSGMSSIASGSADESAVANVSATGNAGMDFIEMGGGGGRSGSSVFLLDYFGGISSGVLPQGPQHNNALIVGGGGQDYIHVADAQNSEIFADSQIAIATAIQNANTGTGTGQNGAVIVVEDGTSLLYELTVTNARLAAPTVTWSPTAAKSRVVDPAQLNGTIQQGNFSLTETYNTDGSFTAVYHQGAQVITDVYDSSGRLVSYDTTDDVHATYTYNDDGTHVESVSTDGESTVTQCDALNRVTSINYVEVIDSAGDTISGGATFTYGGGSFTANVTQGDGRTAQYQSFNSADQLGASGNASTIVGGAGNDVIFVGQGNSLVITGAGNNYVSAGNEVSNFWPTQFNSSIPANWWQDQIYPLVDVHQVITGFNFSTTAVLGFSGISAGGLSGFGNNTILGGTGNDYIELSNGNNYAHGGDGSDTIVGGDMGGNNTIYGGSGNDFLFGGQGNDNIDAGAGDDFISGQRGDDTLFGGDGNDTIYAGSNLDSWATYAAGFKYVDGGTGNDLIFGSAGNDTLFGGDGDDSIYGGACNESIVGGDGNNSLVGGDGNDTLIAGGSGSNWLYAGNGNDTLYGGTGSSYLFGGTGNDVMYAGDGGTELSPTYVFGGTGNNTIYGGSGVEELHGGSGINVIYAGEGGTATDPTKIYAGSGATTIYGGLGVDLIIGGDGTDVLYAGDGGAAGTATSVVAGSGQATLYGGAGVAILQDTSSGDDLLIAGTGDNTVIGSGNDTLIAGTGNDYFVTNSGNETYLFNPNFSNDVIVQNAGTAALEFGVGIEASDLTLTAALTANNQTALEIDGGGGSLEVVGGLTGAVNTITFLDPQTLSLKELIAEDGVDQTLQGANGDLIFSVEDNAAIVAGVGLDTISAWGNNDTITSGTLGTLVYAEGTGDVVYGGVGNDTLIALGAHTTLVGGAGDQLFEVNDVTDVVQSQPDAGNDTILSSVSYVLSDNVGALTLTGTANLIATGNNDQTNLITGNSGNDTLIAGSGNDSLVSGTGVNTLIGGRGADTFVINNSADIIQLLPYTGYQDTVSSSVSYVLNVSASALTLTGAADLTATDAYGYAVITGNAGHDTLIGGAHSDTLMAGSGLATMIAGTGDNTFVVNNSADVIVAGADHGSDTVVSSVNYILPDNVDTLTLTGTDNLTATGNNDTFNYISGNGGNDTLIAGSGADTLMAGTGNNRLIAGAGNDVLYAGAGIDTLVAGTGTTMFYGNAGDTYVLNAGFGNGEIIQYGSNGVIQFGAGITPADLTIGVAMGSDGNPALVIGDGTHAVTVDGALNGSISQFEFANGSVLGFNELLAQAGTVQSSTLTEAAGHLVLSGGTAVSVAGGIGSDTIYGTGANDTLIAGSGNQALYGMNAGDVLIGSVGNDTLHGGSGDDTLIAGLGNTAMYGGQGNDSYMLTQGGTATIYPSSTPGYEAIYLPAGLSFSDFTSYRDASNDLIIQSVSGDTTVTINDFYDTSNANKTWIIASDNDAPQYLRSWVGSSNSGSSDYGLEIDTLRQGYAAQLTVKLNDIGRKGGLITAPDYIQGTGDPNYRYTYAGTTVDNVTVQGGVLSLESSDTEQIQTNTTTHETTYQVSTPTYKTTTTPGKSFFVSFSASSGYGGFSYPGAQVTAVYGPPGSANDPTNPSAAALLGWNVTTPATTRTVQTGTTVTTETVETYTTVTTASQSFIDYNVTGDGGNDVITASSPFVGTVVTGNGNVFVDLTDVSVAPTLDSFRFGFVGFEPWGLGVSPTNSPQLGAFIEAGSGNDTIIGTGGADVIAAGTGFDYIEGNLGTTYYVPMQGEATAVIGDPVEPYGSGPFPLNTLVLPVGITPENLKYRVFQDPVTQSEVLQLTYGDATVLVYFKASPPVEAYNNTDGASAGVNLFQFADGTVLTRDQLIDQATLLPNDFAPVVTALNPAVQSNTTIDASTLFSASDTSDNTITWYQISNSGEGGGHFVLDGKVMPVGQSFMVSGVQLTTLQYVAGSAASTDQIQVSAFDQAIWSTAASFTVTSLATTQQLQTTDANQTLSGPATDPVTLIAAFGNDTLLGHSGQDVLIAQADSDVLIAEGESTLMADAGSDHALLEGGAGATYVIDAASGNTEIEQLSGYGSVQFGTGVALSDLTLSAIFDTQGDPSLVVQAGAATVTLDDAFNGPLNQFTFDDGTSLSLVQLLLQATGVTSTATNWRADGSAVMYSFESTSTNAVYESDSYDTSGHLIAKQLINHDGSIEHDALSYGSDGAYSFTQVITASGANTSSTTEYDFTANGQLDAATLLNTDGSTEHDTYSYHTDGGYDQLRIVTEAGATSSTTMEYGFNATGQLISADITNTDDSTEHDAYRYQVDGSYRQTRVTTDASGATTTTVFDFDQSGQAVSANYYALSTDGSYSDNWAKQDGSHGTYWWNASTHEYMDTEYHADGSTWSDDYVFGSDTPGSSTSYTETYDASNGDHGTRQYDVTSNLTTTTWDSSTTGSISTTTSGDAGFIGLLNDGELTTTQADLNYFNPMVSPSFNAMLAGH